MLDVLLYPVSFVLRCWHTGLGTVLDPGGGPAWALAVVLLVVTLRALLVLPALRQLQSSQRLQALAPLLTELRTRHAGDRAELARATVELQRAHGVSTLGPLLPLLVQLPVVVGLYHVLTQLSRSTTTGGVGAFDGAHVQSFLHAELGGVALSSTVHAGGGLVVVPLLVLAGVLTHLTARAALHRQPPAPGPAAIIGRAGVWVFPLFPLLGGLLFPVPLAIAVYWCTTNLWTLGQNAVLHRATTPRPRNAG